MTHALIIGGGIAGPVAAMALQKAGLDATVYEAYDQSADGMGAFLTMAVNGLAALRMLDIEPTFDGGFDTPRMRIANGAGRQLAEFTLGSTSTDTPRTQTVSRASLYSTLRNEAVHRGIRIEYGRRLVDAATLDSGQVRAEFDDGSQAIGDLLIGADGLRSQTRTIIDPNAPAARYIGLLNTGGIARGATIPGEPGVFTMIFGKRCFLGYTIHPDGDVWWFANPPRKIEPSNTELAAITPDRWRTELLDLFAPDTGPARELIAHTDTILGPWSTFDFPKVPTWHNERMILIGDAAHATSPASGQGASMALEDAVVLAKCLRDADSIPAAFGSYEQLRRQRVEAVVAQGKRNGNQKAVGPVGSFVRDRIVFPLLMKAVARRTNDPMAWIHDYRISWSAPATPRDSRLAHPDTQPEPRRGTPPPARR